MTFNSMAFLTFDYLHLTIYDKTKTLNLGLHVAL